MAEDASPSGSPTPPAAAHDEVLQISRDFDLVRSAVAIFVGGLDAEHVVRGDLM